GAALRLATRGRALGSQAFEPRPIDRLERKPALKTRLRSGLDRCSRFERAPPPSIGLVTLEADSLALGANRPAHPAGPAQDAWAFALQLPAGQRIPLSFNSLSRRGRDRSFHEASLRGDCDRTGHSREHEAGGAGGVRPGSDRGQTPRYRT